MLTGLFQEAQQNRHSIAGAITMASSSSRPISYSSNTPGNCLGFHPRARAALLVCGRIKRRLYYRVGIQTGVCIYIIYIYIRTTRNLRNLSGRSIRRVQELNGGRLTLKQAALLGRVTGQGTEIHGISSTHPCTDQIIPLQQTFKDALLSPHAVRASSCL